MRIEESISGELQSRHFGRKGMAVAMAAVPRSTLVDDLKLFAMTFAAGFLFTSLYLA
ncbi:MAG TPA: hypothetical protein VIJ81_00505 [Sphingomicrobium sp.]|nr:hypothetical protein [Sphingomicrobium sp.]